MDTDPFGPSVDISVTNTVSSDMINGNNELEALASKHRANKLKLQALENEMKELNAVQWKLETEEIPDAMLEAGLTSAELASGTRITIDMAYEARLAKLADGKTVDREKTAKFYEWLTNNGYAGLVQQVFEVFTRDNAVILFLKEVCKVNDIPYEYRTKDVHWRTLEAWYKEQCINGVNLPTHLFHTWIGRRAKLK